MRRDLLAMLHIAKKELALDDETYRDLLERVTGRRSARDMSAAELGKCIDELKTRGFRPKRKAPRSSDPHVRKIWALWRQLGDDGHLRSPDRPALRAFVKRMTGVENPDWLTQAQANTVIEALKAWLERDPPRQPPEDAS